MDNVGMIVESLDKANSFFMELGLELEGRAVIEGKWVGHVSGLGDHRNAPVNALSYLRTMFTVEHLDDRVARLQKHGAELAVR